MLPVESHGVTRSANQNGAPLGAAAPGFGGGGAAGVGDEPPAAGRARAARREPGKTLGAGPCGGVGRTVLGVLDRRRSRDLVPQPDAPGG